jgi:ATP-dependent helicase/nuclease subunit A
MAGAGTGKTSTLVDRCVNCLCDAPDRVSLEELLIVTFTDAAAAEVRKRIREELEKRAGLTGDAHWSEQIALFDTAPIGTLHSFCFKLIQEHFHELGLDPQLTVLDEGQARLMANETLTAVLEKHYDARTSPRGISHAEPNSDSERSIPRDEASEAVRNLIQTQAGGRDEAIRKLVLRTHHYAQTRPNPDAWFAAQLDLFASPDPERWRVWLMEGIADWRARWNAVLAGMAAVGNKKAQKHGAILESLPRKFTRPQAAEVFKQIQSAHGNRVQSKGTGRSKPLQKFVEEAQFLESLAAGSETGAAVVTDPLAEDWEWTRGPMTTLLRLAQEFSARFSEAKREDGVVDFHDLEQLALQLLWNFGTALPRGITSTGLSADAERSIPRGEPTAIARQWRRKIRFVFVDEYQDINAAQDRIIAALSRDGADANRFLVGDVKQSIYRFRLADPQIFRNYANQWYGKSGQTIPLTENFRSREGVLQFVNSVFALLMREEVGGVAYDNVAKLQFGAPDERQAFSIQADPSPRAELILRLKDGSPSAVAPDDTAADTLAELEDAEKEARLVALRLRELEKSRHAVWDAAEKQFRRIKWSDMAVLLRAPAGKAERNSQDWVSRWWLNGAVFSNAVRSRIC